MNHWIIVVITLVFSALCSGLEIAFNSINRLQLEVELTKNSFSAKLIRLFFKNQSRFITSLLLGNNIALIVYGMSMSQLLLPVAQWMLPASLENDFMILLVQTVLATLLVLLVGEFLPKMLFRINPNAILSFFALPTFVCYCLLYPLILIYTGVSEFIIRYVLRLKVDRQEYKFSTVDLNDYIAEYADPEEADEDMQQEIQLFQNVMEFRSVKLRECMGPRNEIESVKLTDSIDVVKARFEETKHSKLIVIGESIDDIVGYIHLNDVVRVIAEHREATLNDLVRTIDFFPETYTADRLLKHFIQKRQGVAAVVDEFGGTAGIVTMEDVVEEIFGEIDDEYDVEDEVEKTVDDNTFVFSARLEIDYLNDNYKLDLPVSDDYETLAGMILHYCESIPEVGEVLEIGNYKVKILKASHMKLDEVELKIKSK
ncbi:MAG: HlyC/CorC family transporter [Bacteroidales bacterium]|jgi:CBS domain containing-hemolysin-like protein|nr:HlyC/CorC family transporter [Bacteroidales bacterium]